MLKDRLNNLQLLRGISALLVLLFHISLFMPEEQRILIVFVRHWGSIGVDVFFVISGFLIYTSVQKANTNVRDAWKFMRNRLRRIVLPYWIATIILIVLSYFKLKMLNFSQLDLICSISFSCFYVGIKFPILSPGWSLEFEMLFYVISFFSIFIAGSVRLALIVIFLSITVYFSLLDAIALNFIAGCLISHFYRTVRLMLLKGIILCCWVLCIFTFNLLPMNSHGVYWALCASTLFGTFLLMPEIKSKLVSYFGDISYGLYLTQMITLPVMSSLFQGMDSFTFLFLATCTSVLVACLFYEVIEKRVTQ